MNYIGRSRTRLLKIVAMLSIVGALGFNVLAQEGVNGLNVTMVDYSDDGSTVIGMFHQNGDGTWTEEGHSALGNQVAETYTEIGRDDWTVSLTNSASGSGVALNLFRKEVTRDNVVTHFIIGSYNDAVATVSTPPATTTTTLEGVVTVYEGCNYEGKASSLNVGEVRFADLSTYGIGNDVVSSVKVSPGYSVDLWEGELGDTTYRKLTLTEDAPCLVDQNFNDTISALDVKEGIVAVTTPVTTTPVTTIPTTTGNTNSVGSSYYNEFSKQLPLWLQFSPNGGNTQATAIGAKQDLPIETVALDDGGKIEYACSTVPYSITQTPQKLVTLDPDSNILYVGSMLQGKGYIEGIGSFAELPIRQRAPIKISIDILSGDNFETVNNPDVQSIDSAIGRLIEKATNNGLKTGGAIDYKKVTSSSLDEASVELGLSAKYIGLTAKNKFNFSRSSSENTIMVNFTQKLFTVRMVQPQTPGELFSNELTPEILGTQMSLGRIGADNIPVYVDSITYGRVMTFSFTSTASEQEIANALDVAYRTPTGDGGGVTLDVNTRKVLSEAKIGLVAIGGSESNALAAIRSGSIGSYFEAGTPLTSAEPISYTIRNVGDNSLAKVSDTLSYNVRTCAAQQSDAPIVAEEIRVSINRIVIKDACDTGSGGHIYGKAYINDMIFELREKNVRDGDMLSLDQPITRDLIYKYGAPNDLVFGLTLTDADDGPDDRVGKFEGKFGQVFDSEGNQQPGKIWSWGGGDYEIFNQGGLYDAIDFNSKPDNCGSKMTVTIEKIRDIREGSPLLNQ